MTKESLYLLDEPQLEFRYAQKSGAPALGLALFGPFDVDSPAHPGTITHGAIGTPAGLQLLEPFLARIQQPVSREYGDPAIVDRGSFLWPTFPGLGAAFLCDWPAKSAWSTAIDAARLGDALRHMDPHRRSFDVCNLYLDAVKLAAQRDDRLAVLLCVIPDDVWVACRPKSRVFGGVGQKPTSSDVKRRREQPELFGFYESEQYDYSVDFRRQLKARAMAYGIPLQLIRESTLRLTDIAALGERGLTPLSDRAWNLSVALYYKAQGKPWRLTTARDGVCYIGLAFRRDERSSDPRSACCAAQMFLDTGDGIVFRGEFGPWYSTKRKQFELGRAAATELLKGVLDTYAQQGGSSLREVFIHSRSRISREEYEGYLEACPQGTSVVGVRVRRDFETRLFRNGKYPVLRGTTWKVSERSAYLWSSGFKRELLTYDGAEVPVPLKIDVQHGSADILQVCRDIQGLTKLNYNACKVADGQPVTVKFSDAVGEILIGNPTITSRKPNFRFYI